MVPFTQRGAGDQLDARRTHADRVHGAAAGDRQHQGRQAARGCAAGAEAFAVPAGRATSGRAACPILKAIRSPAWSCRPERRRTSSPNGAARSPASSPLTKSGSGWSSLASYRLRNTPAEFGERIKVEIAQWGKVVHDAEHPRQLTAQGKAKEIAVQAAICAFIALARAGSGLVRRWRSNIPPSRSG